MATYCGTLLMLLLLAVMSTVADEPRRRRSRRGSGLRPLTARQLNRVGSSRRSIGTQADRRHSNNPPR